MDPEASAGREPLPDGQRPGGASRAAVAWALLAALAALAYRALLWDQPERPIPDAVEEWFFVPSRTWTPAIVGMSLWLLYRRLPRLRAAPDVPGSWLVGGALLGGGVLIYLWSTYTAAEDLLVPSLMLNGLGCAWLWRGKPALRAVALPVAFLVFAMPLPAPLLNQVVYQLQIGTTEVAGAILYALGVPHVVSGERIVRPVDTFSVIEACSGLRSMETLTIVSVLMMDLFRRSGLHAWLVVLAAPPTAFLLNGARAVLLILNPASEIAAVHNLQGVAILLSGVVLLFVLDGVLAWRTRHRGAPAPEATGSAAGAGRGGVPAGAGAAAAALAVAAVASFWLPRWESDPQPPIFLSSRFAGEMAPVRLKELKTDLIFLGSTTFHSSLTTRATMPGGRSVVLFVGVGGRTQRHSSVLSPKTELPGSGWIVEDVFTTTLEPGAQVARAAMLRSGSNRVLSYHWVTGAQSWPLEALRAWLALDRSPLRRSEPPVVVRIGTAVLGPVPQGKIAAEKNLVSFYHLLRPLLTRLESDVEKSFS